MTVGPANFARPPTTFTPPSAPTALDDHDAGQATHFVARRVLEGFPVGSSPLGGFAPHPHLRDSAPQCPVLDLFSRGEG